MIVRTASFTFICIATFAEIKFTELHNIQSVKTEAIKKPAKNKNFTLKKDYSRNTPKKRL